MKNKALIISILISLILAVLPFVIILFISEGKYPTVPVEIMDDSNYYYSRGIEASQGNPFIGNPYIKENRKEVSTSFFVGDWLWATPLFLGFSIQTAIIISQIFWFLVFGIFLYYLFSSFSLEKKYIPWAIAFVLIFVYWYLARPVAMQVVYPVFVIWLTSLILFFRNPELKKNILFLIFSTTLSIYVYTYLTQIIFVALSIVLLATFFSYFKKYRTIWIVGTVSFVSSVPFLMYTWKQIHHPLYFETLSRIGLVNTHMIGYSAVFYVLVVMAGLIIVYFSRDKYLKEELYVIMSVSIGLIIATTSNVFTGKDLELAVHIGRFVELWSVILLCVITQKLCIGDRNIGIKNLFPLAVYVLLITSFFVFQIRVWSNLNRGILDKEIYSDALNWIEINVPKNSVILADDSFSSYVPVMTSSYVLFHPNALLQIDSDEDIKDRYLVSRLFQNLKLEDIKSDMRKYAGAGYTAHRYKVNNRNVKICLILHY